MVHLSPHVLQCRCVRELLPHLERRSVVASKVSSHILGMSDVEAASDLERLLVARIHDGGNEAGKIENVYLALLDCYEEAGSVWCRNVAISVLRPAGTVRCICVSLLLFRYGCVLVCMCVCLMT